MRSSSRGSNTRPPGSPTTKKGFLLATCSSLSHRQLLWLTAGVLCCTFVTVAPSLATLNAITNSSPGRHDSFASPTTRQLNTDTPAPAAAVSGRGEQQQQTRHWWHRLFHRHPQPEAVPVDIVYLWVNGSDPQLHEELKPFVKQQQQQQQAAAAKATGARPSGSVAAAGQPDAVSSKSHAHVTAAARRYLMSAAPVPTQPAKATTAAAKAKAAAPAKPAKRGKPLPLSELPTREARFDAGRDELRYSIRSLEAHLPWYRHLYIVTNGQVPSWLDTSNPRVTVVPHSTIFRNASHLPSFNSNAIQANLLNIPGLSPHFVMMDDDLFLTAPWTLSDFLAPDGGQVTTGSALATHMSGKLPMYMQAIQRLNTIFQARFGSWKRYLPAHTPHFLEVQWLRRLQQQLPGPFEATSAAHLRTSSDVVLSVAYQWYISQFQPGSHPTAPDARAGFASLNNWVAKCYEVAAVNDIRVTPRAAEYRQRVRKTKATSLAVNAEATVGIAVALEAAAAGKPPGRYMAKQIANHTAQLTKAWDQPGRKMVCLQDDADALYDAVRALFNPPVRDFLAARYPTPSQYELPAGKTNGCNRRVKTRGFGHLPTAADMAAACSPSGVLQQPGLRGVISKQQTATAR